jgi:anti-sigma regulatory factor (Ser/Thr protein kinase)
VSHQNSLLAPSTLLSVAIRAESARLAGLRRRPAEDLGFDETRAGKIAIVATELANNIVRHAGGGVIVARVTSMKGEPGAIDLLSLDKGPGMSDVARCLEDGYSTLAGGSGTAWEPSAVFPTRSTSIRFRERVPPCSPGSAP